MKKLLVIAALAMALGACSSDSESTEASGETVEASELNELPETVLEASVVDLASGETVTLGEVVTGDKPVLFWSYAAWCPSCKAEAPKIDAFAAANPEFQVIGIGSADNQVNTEGFITETGVVTSQMLWSESTDLWADLGFSGRTENLVANSSVTEAFDNNGGGFDEALVLSQLQSLS